MDPQLTVLAYGEVWAAAVDSRIVGADEVDVLRRHAALAGNGEAESF